MKPKRHLTQLRSTENLASFATRISTEVYKRQMNQVCC